MKCKGFAFMSHPPVAIPEVGKGQENDIPQTLIGFRRTAEKIKEWEPDVLIIVTPHGNSFRDAISVIDNNRIVGSLSNFGYYKKVVKSIYSNINSKLKERWTKKGIPNVFLSKVEAKQYRLRLELDHGALVPLYFIDEVYKDYEIMHITPGFLSSLQLYKAGMIMAEVMEEQNKSYAIIASADLSHALKDSGPYKYHPDGEKFDELMLKYFQENKPENIFSIPNKMKENAKQCGYNSYVFALGFFDKKEISINVSSYQGTFGVGYMNGYGEIVKDKTTSRLETIKELSNKKYQEETNNEDAYVKLARKAIGEIVKINNRLSWEEFKQSITEKKAEELERKSGGAFVTIHSNGHLRGCIGTTMSTKKNLAEEIIANAISAATRDPRFYPINEDELSELDIKVDVLGDLEKINTKNDLDVNKYGVVVECGKRRGLLLPDLEGVNSVEEQIKIAKEKANIKKEEECVLYRFEVIRHQ
ncbi:MAG: AmmeMemoRadiSam system protein A [Clostridia bacterium]